MDGKKLMAAMLVSIMLVSGLGLVSGGIETDKIYLDEIVKTPTAQGGNGNIIYSAPPPGYEPHATARTVLMEDNTNWGCGPCASHNPEWTATIEANGYDTVAPVYPHVHWPSSTDPWNNYDNMYTWMNGRRSQQGCTYVPWPMIDGAYTDYGQSQAFYQSAVDARLAIDSSVAITSSGALDDPSTGQGWLDVHIEATENLPAADWRVIVQIWENNVTRFGTGPNGESKYDWATWLFLDIDADGTNNHQGVSVWSTGATAGEAVDISYNFNLEANWPRDEIGATVFLQNFDLIFGDENSPRVSVEQAHVQLFDNTLPEVTLVNPDPALAEQVLDGTIPITWSATDVEDDDTTLDISIDYSTDDGNSWTNIMTGTDNNLAPFTYDWDTVAGGIPDGIGYILRVTATDSMGSGGAAISTEAFTIDNILDDEWFFQVESSGTYMDLSVQPAETSMNLAASGGIAAAGDIKLGTWQTTKTFTDSSINGDWTFNIYGKVPNPGQVPLEGYLFARMFTSSDMATPLHTTALDNENVGAFQTSHLFTWASTASGNIANGDSIVIEVWLSVVGGPYQQASGATLNPGLDTEQTPWTFNSWSGSPAGTRQTTGGNPGAYLQINLPAPGGSPFATHTIAGYWQQSFTTGFAPYQSTLSFDYIYTQATSASTLYVFVDTAAGNPVIGTEVWSMPVSAVTGWISVGPLDVTHIVNANQAYYLKIALYHGAATTGNYPCTAGYDNILLTYENPYPWFEMEYDYGPSQSSVVPTISGAGPADPPYEIVLTGKSANSWAFISFPTGVEGNITNILEDSTYGDGMTEWDVAKWYDGQTKVWKSHRKGSGVNTFSTISNTMGVWLRLTANSGDELLTLGAQGNVPASTTIPLYAGWNMVGYPSVTSRSFTDALSGTGATMVARYIAASPYVEDIALPSAEMMSHGNAYWIKVPSDANWVVNW